VRQLIALAVNIAGRKQATYLSCPEGRLTLPLACLNHPLGNVTSKGDVFLPVLFLWKRSLERWLTTGLGPRLWQL